MKVVDFVVFEATSKTLKSVVVCVKEELADRLREYRTKGRSVSLPEKLCKVEMCQEFKWSCVRCIKKFYEDKTLKLDLENMVKDKLDNYIKREI